MARLSHKVGSNGIVRSEFVANQTFQKTSFSSVANSLSEFNLSRAVRAISLACIFPFISACATIESRLPYCSADFKSCSTSPRCATHSGG